MNNKLVESGFNNAQEIGRCNITENLLHHFVCKMETADELYRQMENVQ